MDTQPTRTLLVESCPSASRALAALLEGSTPRHRVTSCAGAPEALRTLCSASPCIDLVLVSQQLAAAPELLAAVRAPELRHVPVVVLAEAASQAEVMALLRAGAADVLCGPLRRQEAATLWQHVWRRRAACAPRSLLDVPGEHAPQQPSALSLGKAPQGGKAAAQQQQQQQQQPSSGSLHSEESHPASDNSSSSALRLDLASSLQGSISQPAPTPLLAALPLAETSAAATAPPREAAPFGVAAAPFSHPPSFSSPSSCSGLAPPAQQPAATVTALQASGPEGASTGASGSGAVGGSAQPVAASPQGDPTGEQAAKQQQQQRAYVQAVADSLTAFRLALRVLPAPPPVQLGITPLRVPAPSPGAAPAARARLAALGTLSAPSRTLGLPLGVPLGGQAAWAPRSAPPARSSPPPQVAPLKRTASAALPQGAPKRAAPPRTRHSAASQPALEEADGPAAWRANRQAALVRWREKRAARKFTKTVRYESRRRLAAARPRVRGQFVKAVKMEA